MLAIASAVLALTSSMSVSASPLASACASRNWDSFQSFLALNWATGLFYNETWATAEVLCAAGSKSFTFNVVDASTCVQLSNDPEWFPQYGTYKNVSSSTTEWFGSGVHNYSGPITGPCVTGGYVDLAATWNANMSDIGRPKTAFTITFA